MPIWVFVSTSDRFGLFNCMSVAGNLPKSVLLWTKQFIFHLVIMKHLEGKIRSTKWATFVYQKGINPCSIHYRYVHTDVYFSVVYKNKRLYPPKLNSTSASHGPERLEMVSKNF